MKKFLCFCLSIGLILSCAICFSACEMFKKDNLAIIFCVDGEEYSNFKTNGKEKIELPDNPTKHGYTFEGWYTDEDFENELDVNGWIDKELQDNVSVYAKFTINQYTITFNTNEGSVVESITQDYNSVVEKPTDPTKEGYTFGGWYTDNNTFANEYLFTTMQSENIILYAKWNIETYTITYNLNGGNNDNNPINYTHLVSDITLQDASKEGYTFEGWYTEENYINRINVIDTSLKKDYDLYAKFTINQYTITFNTNEGSVVESITQDYDSVVQKPADPTKEGYTFGGWYTDNDIFANEYLFTTMQSDNIILYAKWNIEIYTITYHLDNGKNGNNPESYTILTDDITLQDASKDGYGFEGWYTDQEYTNKIESIDTNSLQNYNLYAKLTLIYTTVGNKISGLTNYGKTQKVLLIPSIIDGVEITTIWGRAFHGNSIIESVVISKNIKSIDYGAFGLCENLRSVVFEEGSQLQTIGGHAFSGCFNLISITIPSNVVNIGEDAFNCARLTEVYNYSNVLIEKNSSIFNRHDTKLLDIYSGEMLNNQSKLITINNVVYYVENENSYIAIGLENNNITEVSLHEKTTKLNDFAFWCCRLLESVSTDNASSLNSIGINAFAECDSLVSLTIPSSVKNIGNSAFYGSGIQELTFSEGSQLQSVNLSMFLYCYNLIKLVFKENSQLQTIEENTFTMCTSLASITLPSNLISIGNNAFFNCRSLVEVYNYSNLPITKGNIDYGSVAYYAIDVYSGETINTTSKIEIINNVVYYVENENSYIAVSLVEREFVTEVVLDEKTTRVHNYAFCNTTSLQEVTITSNIATIEDGAFSNCGGDLLFVIIESEIIANGLVDKNVYGGLIGGAAMVYIKTGLDTTDSTFLNENFVKYSESNRDLYDLWVRTKW